MTKILYCVNKSAKNRKPALPFPVRRTAKIKDINAKKIDIFIFDEAVLKSRPKMTAADFPNKICFIRFCAPRKENIKKANAFGAYGYFTEADPCEDILYKINQAKKLVEHKEKIRQLEGTLLNKNKELERFILIDPLTGCYNWRYFSHYVQHELNRARRRHYNISFLVVDIDWFQQINEVYSFKVADTIIKEMVVLIKKMLRKEDILTRWREDEFFIIAPYLALKDACKVARRIKDTVFKHTFKHREVDLKIKVSIGIVSYPEDSISSVQDIISMLNKCLVAAKRQGGNTIVVHSQPKLDNIFKHRKKISIKELKAKVERLNILSTRDLLEVIYGFARTIEAKDFYTGKHVEDTAAIVEEVAKELNLSDAEINNIKPAAVLHDLGKVGIDKSILGKKGPLTPQERKIIETHPSIAAEILRGIHVFRGMIPAILYHHERFDGKGYPLGLKGEEIPLSARIIAVADVYQALVSDRPYRKAFSKEKAIEIIREESGTHFDPKIVDIFLRILEKHKSR